MQFEDDIALGLNAGNEMSSCVRAPAGPMLEVLPVWRPG